MPDPSRWLTCLVLGRYGKLFACHRNLRRWSRERRLKKTADGRRPLNEIGHPSQPCSNNIGLLVLRVTAAALMDSEIEPE